MKKIILFLFLFISLSTSIVYSQPQFEWVRNYPMQGKAAAMDSTGNVYTVGYIGNTTIVLKYNSNGNLVWSRIDSIHTNGTGICAAADKYGNVYYTADDILFRIATIKYDSSGIRKWIKYYYDTLSIARANAIAVDYAGNICITGYGRKTSRYNYLTIKYNPQGDTLWTAIYNSPYTIGGSSANAICIDLQNNVYVTGGSVNVNTSQDYVTVKYNSSGIQQWVAIYDGNDHAVDVANCIIVDKFGNSYVTGSTYYDNNKNVIGTIKYAPNGDSVWTRLYFPPLNFPFEYGNNILLDTSLNVYITGQGGDLNNFRDFRIIKYNNNGNLLWTKLDSDYIFIPYSSILDKYDNIYLTGSTEYTIYSTEYSSSGIKIWNSHYPQPTPQSGSYSGVKFFKNNYNNLYLFGCSLDSSILIKYGLLTNIYQTTEIINTSYKLYQNYPNPFNPSTNIKFEVPLSKGGLKGVVSLKIYDITGREIQTLVNESLKPGSYEVTFDGSLLPSGVYFYKLTTEGFSETKKMLFLK